MILGREPALILGAISAGVNLLILLHVIALDADQVAALNIFAAAVVAVIVRQNVTPTAAPKLAVGTAVDTADGGKGVVAAR